MPRLAHHLRSGVQDWLGQHGETLSLLKKQKLAGRGGRHLYPCQGKFPLDGVTEIKEDDYGFTLAGNTQGGGLKRSESPETVGKQMKEAEDRGPMGASEEPTTVLSREAQSSKSKPPSTDGRRWQAALQYVTADLCAKPAARTWSYMVTEIVGAERLPPPKTSALSYLSLPAKRIGQE
ncbi:hypothetical protein AAY473_016405 [Plecturocebus cupreus]